MGFYFRDALCKTTTSCTFRQILVNRVRRRIKRETAAAAVAVHAITQSWWAIRFNRLCCRRRWDACRKLSLCGRQQCDWQARVYLKHMHICRDHIETGIYINPTLFIIISAAAAPAAESSSPDADACMSNGTLSLPFISSLPMLPMLASTRCPRFVRAEWAGVAGWLINTACIVRCVRNVFFLLMCIRSLFCCCIPLVMGFCIISYRSKARARRRSLTKAHQAFVIMHFKSLSMSSVFTGWARWGQGQHIVPLPEVFI